ncbi:MAG TPA: hypothetical protein VK395_00610 [Gemmataceae bacterium]|nr:hypothetical protein [Gemmataceae bacterium]
MSEQFPGLMVAYLGPNAAHREFRTALANAKALAFILAEDNTAVLRAFLDKAEQTKSKAGGPGYALGMAGGRSTTTTVQLAVHLTGNEIDLINAVPGGFISQALGLVYREVSRAFETYLVDLFGEIATRKKQVLFSGQTLTHQEALEAAGPAEIHRLVIERRKAELTRVGFAGLQKTYDNLNLPIVPTTGPEPAAESDDVRRRLVLMNAIRNVIEHNRAVVNADFLRLVPDSPWAEGQIIAITVTELGDALSAVEWAGNSLNGRAVDKYGIDKPE